MLSRHLVFLGDSTLDNILWVGGSFEKSITYLVKKMSPGTTVTNYAADGFTSEDTRFGAAPLISRKVRESVDPFPSDRIFKPLEHLKRLQGVTHVVVSVGGNDIREILGHMDQLSVRLSKFYQNYPAIINEIVQVTPKVIVMLQYRPSYDMDDHYHVYKAMHKLSGTDSVATINALIEGAYTPIFNQLRQMKLPIIDLPNTFDIYDKSLYTYQIEPSEKGGTLIAKLIAHVLEHHDWNGVSKFYKSKGLDDEITSVDFTDKYVWKIDSTPQQQEITAAVKSNLISKLAASSKSEL